MSLRLGVYGLIVLGSAAAGFLGGAWFVPVPEGMDGYVPAFLTGMATMAVALIAVVVHGVKGARASKVPSDVSSEEG